MRTRTKLAPGEARRLRVRPLLLALAVAAGGCAGGSGSGSSGGGSVAAPGSAGTSNAATQAHWQVALAALGGSGTTVPLHLDQRGADAWNDLLARNWPDIRDQLIDPRIEAALVTQLTSLSQGAVTVRGLRNLVIDTAAPPGLLASSIPGLQDIGLELPLGAGRWRIAFTVDVDIAINTQLFGVPIQTVVALSVDAEARDVQVRGTARLDVSNPSVPALGTVMGPSASLALTLSSPSPLLSQVTPILTQVLDPIIRTALLSAPFLLQGTLSGLLAQLPAMGFGAGQPAIGPVTGSMDLEAIAKEIAAVIRRDHMPWKTVLCSIYDQAGYGNGQVVEYFDHGDSVGWTNHFVMGEVIRYDLTGDPEALEHATRGMDGTLDCLEVGFPGGGLLGRCVVPLADPLIAQISGNQDFYTGVVHGVPMGSLGDMSRDHYTESLMGTMQAWLRVPALRPRAEEIVTRMIDYFESVDWNIRKGPNTQEVSRGAPWAQSDAGVLAFVRAGFLIDPARYGQLHARWEALSQVIWLSSWLSALEVHEQYYKFNLGHDALVTLYTSETDPVRYRDYVRAQQIYREAIGHHDNAWFDTVYGMGVPAAAQGMGPRIRNALEQWTQRPRRCFDPALDADPTITKIPYSSALTLQPRVVAAEVIPIPKRVANDFLWQRSPFELHGYHTGSKEQYPGIDFTQPYWTARAYGMVQ